jgi:hypothetical protein
MPVIRFPAPRRSRRKFPSHSTILLLMLRILAILAALRIIGIETASVAETLMAQFAAIVIN